jgi:hypothetical protein
MSLKNKEIYMKIISITFLLLLIGCSDPNPHKIRIADCVKVVKGLYIDCYGYVRDFHEFNILGQRTTDVEIHFKNCYEMYKRVNLKYLRKKEICSE